MYFYCFDVTITAGLSWSQTGDSFLALLICQVPTAWVTDIDDVGQGQ